MCGDSCGRGEVLGTQRWRTAGGWDGTEPADAGECCWAEQRGDDGSVKSRANVTITARGQKNESSGTGNGPVNAIDTALRSGLEKLYPELNKLELTDYKVRILEGRLGTGAVTRVLVETSDGNGEWSTIGVHENVIAASAMALEDAVTYGLLRQGKIPE